MRIPRYLPLAALALGACSQEQPVSESGTDTPEPAATAAPEPAPPRSDIAFRHTGLVDCPLLRSAPEEAGFFEHECAGEGGWRLKLVESDLRENIVVLPSDGSEHSLNLPALADGAFSSVGETVEWRGRGEGDDFTPETLLLRHTVMEDPDPEVPKTSYLLAVRLGGAPCVIARIAPGPDQNLRARDAADRGGECLSAKG